MRYFEFLFSLGLVGNIFSLPTLMLLLASIVIIGVLLVKYVKKSYVLLFAFPGLIVFPFILFYAIPTIHYLYISDFDDYTFYDPWTPVIEYGYKKDYYRKIETARAYGDAPGEAQLFYELGDYYDAIYEHELARDAYYMSISLFKRLEDPENVAKSYVAINTTYLHDFETEPAKRVVAPAVEHYKATENYQELSSLFYRIAQSEEYNSNYEKALESARISLESANKYTHETQDFLGALYLMLARLEFLNDNYQNAIDANMRALPIFEEFDQPWKQANILMDISDIHFTYEENEKALTELRKADQIILAYLEHNEVDSFDYLFSGFDAYIRGEIFERYATIYSDNGDLEALRNNLIRHRAFYDSWQIGSPMGHLLRQYAIHEMDNQEYDQARALYREAIEYSEENFEEYLLPTLYSEFASLEMVTQNPDQAIEQMESAIDAYEWIDNYDMAEHLRKQLEVYKQTLNSI